VVGRHDGRADDSAARIVGRYAGLPAQAANHVRASVHAVDGAIRERAIAAARQLVADRAVHRQCTEAVILERPLAPPMPRDPVAAIAVVPGVPDAMVQADLVLAAGCVAAPRRVA
jgi:hypothetical protein